MLKMNDLTKLHKKVYSFQKGEIVQTKDYRIGKVVRIIHIQHNGTVNYEILLIDGSVDVIDQSDLIKSTEIAELLYGKNERRRYSNP